jgi:hypothetical protein
LTPGARIRPTEDPMTSSGNYSINFSYLQYDYINIIEAGMLMILTTEVLLECRPRRCPVHMEVIVN